MIDADTYLSACTRRVAILAAGSTAFTFSSADHIAAVISITIPITVTPTFAPGAVSFGGNAMGWSFP